MLIPFCERSHGWFITFPNPGNQFKFCIIQDREPTCMLTKEKIIRCSCVNVFAMQDTKSRRSVRSDNARLMLCMTTVCLRNLFHKYLQLKQWRRRRLREQQKSHSFRLAKNNFAGASRDFVHYFAVVARLLRETS